MGARCAAVPCDGPHALVLLLQPGNADAVFGLQLAVVAAMGGMVHLRTLQVDRCCIPLLNASLFVLHVFTHVIVLLRVKALCHPKSPEGHVVG